MMHSPVHACRHASREAGFHPNNAQWRMLVLELAISLWKLNSSMLAAALANSP